MKKIFCIIILFLLVNVFPSCSIKNEGSGGLANDVKQMSSGEPITIDRKRMPREDVGVTIDGEYAATFMGNSFKYSNIELTSVAIAPYSIIIAGSYSDNKHTGYINERKGDPNDIMNTEWKDYKLEVSGPIILQELLDDNKKVVFTYDEGKKKGYFDIEKSLVILEEYK